MCVTYYGMLRGKSKGREKEGFRWVEEEQAWENREKRG